jgi:transposase
MMGTKKVEAKLFYEFSLDRRVPEDHLLRRIERAVDFAFVYRLTRPFYSHTGQPSVDPVVLFKMALLGYLYGLPSERRLAQEAELNLAYRWFLGYDLDEATPNHSVLSKARRRFGKEVYEEFFRQIVGQCEAAGLIEGTTVFLDSTQVLASANSDSSRSRTLLQQLPGRPEAFVQQLWEANPEEPGQDDEGPHGGKKGSVNRLSASRTDPEAGMVTRPPGPPRFTYKDHLCVDGGKARIVTAVKVTAGHLPDEHQLRALIEAHSELLGRMPRRVSADTKYGTRANYEYLFERGIAPSIPLSQIRLKSKEFTAEAFRYDLESDVYWCPTGKPLHRRVEAPSSDAVIYRANPADCRACQFQPRCTTSPQGRRILRLRGQEYRDRAREHLATEQAKIDIRRRRVWIEGVFADAKAHHGLAKARSRGLAAVTIQALLVASVQNIKKLAWNGRPNAVATASASVVRFSLTIRAATTPFTLAPATLS